MMGLSLPLIILLVASNMDKSVGQRLVQAGTQKECKGPDNSRLCDGAALKTLSTTVQVCVKGRKKLIPKKKLNVKALPSSDAPCEWYGQLYCNGDIVVDLYRWWFLKKCASGRMYVYGRTWLEVAQDPRF